MNFNELLQACYELTSRPDLVAVTKSAIKAATLKAHRTDFYSKDIYETGVEFTTKDFRQHLDYVNLIPNFRTLKYLRRVQDEHDDNGTFFEVVTPEELLDDYNQQRSDVVYVAGRVLEIQSAVSFDKCLLGAYVMPITTEEGYSSWVASMHPQAIIYEACRVIFKTIGYDEQSATYRSLVAEEYEQLKTSALTDVGY